jgi:3-carboxy-cis,cis-muconate cycloisomerase
MRHNLDLEKGRTLSEAYMFQLATVLGREAAHDLVYEAATLSRSRATGLREALLEVAAAAPGGVDTSRIPLIEPGDYLGRSREEAVDAVADWREQRRSAR